MTKLNIYPSFYEIILTSLEFPCLIVYSTIFFSMDLVENEAPLRWFFYIWRFSRDLFLTVLSHTRLVTKLLVRPYKWDFNFKIYYWVWEAIQNKFVFITYHTNTYQSSPTRRALPSLESLIRCFQTLLSAGNNSDVASPYIMHFKWNQFHTQNILLSISNKLLVFI